ncbi:hypothetical protein [Aquimarina mytili]|uniref:Uncharacterized protein n=1 Tax=Aquimarina mytili TaxID=874423 RepID=A0A936ZWR9_9FLAO|nr:hypothetical protein [Aquimarina mytili]MBL0682456.1 hypothetical protein [Aquimarina mytili]
MTTQMHLAAQYLAAAGISFIEKKQDDSHTNLGFSIESESLFTRPLNADGVILSLSYALFTLEWIGNNATKRLQLDGTSHAQVMQWINSMVIDSGFEKAYSYDLHYELPYQITDDYVFKLQDASRLKKLIEYRKLAQLAIQEFLKTNRFDSEIRIWPHHFDTGAFTTVDTSSGVSIGLGLAIPDSMCKDYYFYISGYRGHDGLDTNTFKSLIKGKWYNDGFKGAVLPISGINKTDAVTFFNEALIAYTN